MTSDQITCNKIDAGQSDISNKEIMRNNGYVNQEGKEMGENQPKYSNLSVLRRNHGNNNNDNVSDEENEMETNRTDDSVLVSEEPNEMNNVTMDSNHREEDFSTGMD